VPCRAAQVLLEFDAHTFCRVIQTALDSPFYVPGVDEERSLAPSREIVFSRLLEKCTSKSSEVAVLNLISSYAQRHLIADKQLIDTVLSHLVENSNEEALITMLEKAAPSDVQKLVENLERRNLYRVLALVHRVYTKDPAKVIDAYLKCSEVEFSKLVFAYCLSVEEEDDDRVPRDQAALMRASDLVRLDPEQVCCCLCLSVCGREDL